MKLVEREVEILNETNNVQRVCATMLKARKLETLKLMGNLRF